MPFLALLISRVNGPVLSNIADSREELYRAMIKGNGGRFVRAEICEIDPPPKLNPDFQFCKSVRRQGLFFAVVEAERREDGSYWSASGQVLDRHEFERWKKRVDEHARLNALYEEKKRKGLAR
jgi:hypothetical protein